MPNNTLADLLRTKLKTVDEEELAVEIWLTEILKNNLCEKEPLLARDRIANALLATTRKRRILRQICDLEANDEIDRS